MRLACLLVLLWAGAVRAAVPSVYLVQNSGWMEPFFADRASPFKPLLVALTEASHTGATIVATFNQDGQVPGHRSPEVAYDGPWAAGPVAAAVDGLVLAARPGGRLADADFNGALVRTLDGVLDGKPGIVWVVTNNKNSRSNSPEIDRNTRAFAELLRNSPFLPFVVAYPVRMPVTGRLYTERGLILYAIAYGEEAATALQAVVAGPAMRALFTEPPVRLKHLEEAPLVFTPSGAQAAARAQPGGGVLLQGVSAAGGEVRLPGSLRSDYYPQTIVGANLALSWVALDGVADPASLPARVDPSALAHLAAGAELPDVTLVVHVPAVPRPAGLAGLFAQSSVLHGRLQLRLTDMTMALSEGFVARMADIAALDQLPDVFADIQRVSTATSIIPVTLAVSFSPWPLIGLLCAAGLALAGLVAAASLGGRARHHSVLVDGRRQAVVLRPFQSRRLPMRDGGMLVVTGRLWGAPATRIEKPSRAA